MAQETIPAEFAKGTKVTKVSGLWNSIQHITEGEVTRTTKTLAFVTFTHADGRTYEGKFKFVKPFTQYGKPAPELRLVRADAPKYSDDRSDLYLADAEGVTAAHALNARLRAQGKARMVAEALSGKNHRGISRDDVEVTIAELTALLADLKPRGEI